MRRFGLRAGRRGVGGGSVPQAWTPIIGGATRLWRADTGATASQWTGLDSTPTNATQSEVTYQPVPDAGPPALVSFSGVQVYIEDTVVSTGALTWGVVFKAASNPAGGSFRSLRSICQSETTFFELILSALGGGYLPYTFLAKAGSATAVGINVALDTDVHRMIVAYDGGTATDPNSYTVLLDGTARTVATSAALARETTQKGSIGARAASDDTPDYGFVGNIYCDTVFPSALTDLTALDAYLAAVPTS